jgi:hypothetical protein
MTAPGSFAVEDDLEILVDHQDDPYTEACETLRTAANATGCMLFVLGGDHGHRLSLRMPKEIEPLIPTLLRVVALKIEKDVRAKRDARPLIACPICSSSFRIRTGQNARCGSRMVCQGCGSFLHFDDPDTIRVMTTEEVIALPDETRIAMLRRRREADEAKAARLGEKSE